MVLSFVWMLMKESWGTEPVFHAFVRLMHMNLTYLRLSRIKFREEAKRLLFKYAEAAKRLIESRWELFSQCCHVQKRQKDYRGFSSCLIQHWA